MKRVPILSAFNAGELSPLMAGRVELDKYATGAATIENMMVKLPGPLERRGGSVFVAPTVDEAVRVWLPRFYFNKEQAYAVEMTPGVLRLFTQRGLLESAPGDPFELEHTYEADDLTDEDGLFRPSYVQSGDVVFFANGRQRPKSLSRLGATEWTWTDADFYGGPFKEENDTETQVYLGTVVQAGQTTGLIASDDIFTAEHVGSLFELRAINTATPAWTPEAEIDDPDVARYWDGNYYHSTTTGTTGTLPPTHTEGSVSDGGVGWRYSHSGRVVVKILSVLEPVRCLVEMQTDPVGEVTTSDNATPAWSFGAWSDVEGWPEKVAFFRDRLCFSRGRRVWCSVVGDYTNFSARTGGLILPENAISIRVAAGRAEEVKWLYGDDELLIGTSGGVMVMREQTQQQPLGAGNVTVVPGPAVGVAATPPIVSPSGQLLFVDRTRTGLRAIAYSAEAESYRAPILTRMADHALLGQVVDCAFQAHPAEVLWCLLANGELAALTFDPDDGVFAWHRHAIAGQDAAVEAIAILPSPPGAPGNERDDLWLAVRRTIGGQTRRYVEYLEAPFQAPARSVGETRKQYRARVSAAVPSCVHCDSATLYEDEDNLVTVCGGLDHLEGLEVAVLADGTPYRLTVEGGEVTLRDPARVARVGLPYRHRFVGLPPETGAATGTAMGRTKRVHRIDLRVFASLGSLAGTSEENLKEVRALAPWRAAETVMGGANPLFFGDAKLDDAGGYDTEGVVVVEGDEPLPFTLIAIIPHHEVGER
jgi:hypothetical protein